MVMVMFMFMLMLILMVMFMLHELEKIRMSDIGKKFNLISKVRSDSTSSVRYRSF
jgi:hypothetical protein